jgi:ATP phosphoribosyltransferase regulatory subunit
MTTNNRWLLPDGVEEILPAQARQLEQLHRELLDMYSSWGYELIIPPFIEYLDSLLTGTGNELDLRTFKLIDQISGRLLGVRADMTPQAARIDTHRLRRKAPSRLCYLGTVLHTLPDGFSGSRSPMQAGAELFGHSGIESDVEILELMVETLLLTGIEDVHIDIGHVGIFRGLAAEAMLDIEQEKLLFDALQRKAIPEIKEFLQQIDLSDTHRMALSGLADLNGGDEVFDQARELLENCGDPARLALDNLHAITQLARKRLPLVDFNFDLAELRGYEYQTGVVFAAFVAEHGQEVARGGRYDQIGKEFGSARMATGFSTDLRTLIALGKRPVQEQQDAILAPCNDDVLLQDKVRELRAAGDSVIFELPGQSGTASEMGCARKLVWNGAEWAIEDL